MRRRGWLLAVALVLVADAWILASAWRNRSAEPTSELVLTEREAPLSGVAGPEWENSGLSLLLNWQGRWGTEGADASLDEAKLAELGFDMSIPVTDARAQRHYSTMLARDVFVVLENDGPSRAEWQARQEALLPETLERLRANGVPEQAVETIRLDRERQVRDGSHLILVDSGLDPAALRGRHPDTSQALVARAVASVSFDGKRVTGRITAIRADVIHVPRRLAGDLQRLRNAPASPWSVPPRVATWDEVAAPRYAVRVRWGRNFEPWLVEVLPPPPPM